MGTILSWLYRGEESILTKDKEFSSNRSPQNTPDGKKKIGHRISKNHGNQGKICIDVFKLPTETQYAETKDNQSLQLFGVSKESNASTSFVKGKCANLPVVKLPPPPPPPPPVIPT